MADEALSFVVLVPGDPETEGAWGTPLNALLEQIKAAVRELQIPFGVIVGTDEATALAARPAGWTGLSRLAIEPSEAGTALVIRCGPAGGLPVDVVKFVDRDGSPIVVMQDAGNALIVNDRAGGWRSISLAGRPAWQYDIYGYRRRQGTTLTEPHADYVWDGPPGNLLSHEDAVHEVFDGTREPSLGTWAISGDGQIAGNALGDGHQNPNGGFWALRITATGEGLTATVGQQPAGTPVYPAAEGEVYSVVGALRAVDDGEEAAWGIQWFGPGGFISQSLGTAEATDVGEWVIGSSGGLTAPAGTTGMSAVVSIADAEPGQSWDIGGVAIYRGAETRLSPPFVGSGQWAVWGEAAEGDLWFDRGTGLTWRCTTGGVPSEQVWELHTVPTTRTITAGDGLTGGGDLSADRTLATLGLACRLYASSAVDQEIESGNLDQITLDEVEFNDSTSHFTPDVESGSSLTVNKAGLYLLDFQVKFGGGSAGDRYASVYINGVTLLREAGSGGATDTTAGTATVVRLQAGDELTLHGYVDGGATADVITSQPYETGLLVAYLGA